LYVLVTGRETAIQNDFASHAHAKNGKQETLTLKRSTRQNMADCKMLDIIVVGYAAKQGAKAALLKRNGVNLYETRYIFTDFYFQDVSQGSSLAHLDISSTEKANLEVRLCPSLQ
jgi:hypothetical protein